MNSILFGLVLARPLRLMISVKVLAGGFWFSLCAISLKSNAAGAGVLGVALGVPPPPVPEE
jgi:hypothetical protein